MQSISEGTSESINELARILKEQELTQFPLEDQKHLLLLVFRIQKIWSQQRDQYQPKHDILKGLSYFLNNSNFYQVYTQNQLILRQREKDINDLTERLNLTTNQLSEKNDQYQNLRKIQDMIKQGEIQEESLAYRDQMKFQTEQFESMKIENMKLIERLKLEKKQLINQLSEISEEQPYITQSQKVDQELENQNVNDADTKSQKKAQKKIVSKKEYQRHIVIQQPKGQGQKILFYLIGLVIGLIFFQKLI